MQSRNHNYNFCRESEYNENPNEYCHTSPDKPGNACYDEHHNACRYDHHHTCHDEHIEQKEQSKKNKQNETTETMHKKILIELFTKKFSALKLDTLNFNLGQSAFVDTLKAENLSDLWLKFLHDFEHATENNILNFIATLNQETEVEIAIAFLKTLNKDLKATCREKIGLLISKLDSALPNCYTAAHRTENGLETLPLSAKHSLLRHVVNSILLEEVFDLKPNAWQPQDGFEALFSLFHREKRPLIMGGFFGESYYNEPSQSITTTSLPQYEVRSWGKNNRPDLVSDTSEDPHEIVIIGLERNNNDPEEKRWVYYIDPVDPSDPNIKDSKRKVYKISYEEFAKFVKDNTGFVHRGIEVTTGRQVLLPLRTPGLEYGYS